MGFTLGTYLATDSSGWSTFTGKLDTGTSSGWANQQGSGYPGAGQNGDGTRYIYVSVAGNDANTGTFASPKRHINGATGGVSLLRFGFPDWLMLRKGDTWTDEPFEKVLGDGMPLVGQGLDATNLMLLTAYDPANPSVANPSTGGISPIVQTSNGQYPIFNHKSFFGIIGITLYSYERDPTNGSYVGAGNAQDCTAISSAFGIDTVIMEDCECSYYGNGTAYPSDSTGVLMNNLIARRSVVYNTYNDTGHVSVGCETQGNTTNALFEELALNHNGWLSVRGVQNRGFYLSIAEDSLFTNPMTVRGCIVSNDSSGSQLRSGGTIDNNLSFQNEYMFDSGAANAGYPYKYTNNVSLETLSEGFAYIATGGGNRVELGSIEISGNIFSHESVPASSTISIGVGANGCSTHDNVVYKWGNPYNSTIGCPISFDTIVGGSGFTTGTDFYFIMSPGVPIVVGDTYTDGLGNTFSVVAQTATPPLLSTIVYFTRTVSGSTPAQNGTLTRASGSGPSPITYANAYRIFYDVPMKYVTSGAGTGLECTIYTNMSGAVAIVQIGAGIVFGPNYTQPASGYSVADQVTNTSAFGGGIGFNCKVSAIGVNTEGSDKFDPTGSIHAGGGFPEWIDPERSISTYAASIGLAATEAAFIEAVKTNRKWNYNPAYTANAANIYIRAGFGIPGNEITISFSPIHQGQGVYKTRPSKIPHAKTRLRRGEDGVYIPDMRGIVSELTYQPPI